MKDRDSSNSRPCSPAVSVKSNKSNQDSSTKDDIDILVESKPAKGRKSSNLFKEKESDIKPKTKDKEKEITKDVKENLKPEEVSFLLAKVCAITILNYFNHKIKQKIPNEKKRKKILFYRVTNYFYIYP